MILDQVRKIVGDAEFEEDMIAFATTASSKEIRLRAEMALRKMYPSSQPALKIIKKLWK